MHAVRVLMDAMRVLVHAVNELTNARSACIDALKNFLLHKNKYKWERTIKV